MNELTQYTTTLLSKWCLASSKRRAIEHSCGYPPEYGGDEELLQETKDLLMLILDISEKS